MSAMPRPNPLEINPLWLKGLRSRCRFRHLASWGVLWLTLATFVFLLTYLGLTEQEQATKADAAKASLLGILVIQAIILMFFGTGAVALGVSQERDEQLLDYVRMTPMSPTAKIFGYLFGLPAREYLLVALTMPFVIVVVLISGFSLLTLAHFYLVFFMSVLVYHMTAMVAGMVSPKPRLASMTSMGIVVVLYFVLPNLSRIGITFFEFLTIRPTFFGLVQQELPEQLRMQAERSGIDSFRPVPFFEGSVRPTVYTVLVQGFLIVTMFGIVHRKWRDAQNNLFSKGGALVIYVGVAFFTLGSIWAVVAQDSAYDALFGGPWRNQPDGRAPETFSILITIGLLILGLAYTVLIVWSTASRERASAGVREAAKLGRTRLGWNSDAASSLPLALVMIAIAVGGGAGLLGMAINHGDYIASWPTAPAMVAVLLLVGGLALTVQGLVESLSTRVYSVVLFIGWMVPFFAMIILMAAFEEFRLALYVGQPFPPVSIGLSLGWMLETTETPMVLLERSTRFLPRDGDAPDVFTNPGRVAATGAIGYAAAAVLAQGFRHLRRRALRAAG